MSTLPRPASQLPKNVSQFRPPIVYPRTSNSALLNPYENNFNSFSTFSNTANKADTTDNESDRFIEDQLKTTRKGAQQQFDSYMSKIRQVERNIASTKRRMEQKAKQMASKTSESISSLYSEILQLNNTHNILKRKVDTIQKTALKSAKNGLKKAIKTLDDDFQSFKADFDESLSNVETLIQSLEGKVRIIKNCLSSFDSFQTDISIADFKIKEINKDHYLNVEKLKAIENELIEDTMNDQTSKIDQFNLRLRNLKARIKGLQQKTTLAFNQSQTAYVTAQTGVFELRSKFDKQMTQTQENFKFNIDDIKKQIKASTKSKYKYIDETNERIKKSREMIAKIQKRKLKKAAEFDQENDFSIKNQIKRIKQKVNDLEQTLNDHKNKKMNKNNLNASSKNDLAKIYYNFDENGEIKIIIIVNDDVVLL